MRTNIDIDDVLIAKVMSATGTKTKRDAVDAALRQTLQLRRQEGLIALWGIGWEGDLDDMRTSKHLPE